MWLLQKIDKALWVSDMTSCGKQKTGPAEKVRHVLSTDASWLDQNGQLRAESYFQTLTSWFSIHITRCLRKQREVHLLTFILCAHIPNCPFSGKGLITLVSTQMYWSVQNKCHSCRNPLSIFSGMFPLVKLLICDLCDDNRGDCN